MLSTKYNIPIENISYEYIGQMKNKSHEKELEKIIKILESGELGLFPHLLETAKEKLREINKNNKMIAVKPEPIKKLDNLDREDVQRIKNDLQEWCKQMKQRDSESRVTEFQKMNENDERDKELCIRGESILKSTENNKKISRIKGCDYETWDRFNAEVELKKMDVRIEQEKEKIKRQKNAEAADEMKYLTPEEKIMFADNERIKGNECYQAHRYSEAINHYRSSIDYHPSAMTYSNRAQAYIKLKQFAKALQDCDQALTLDNHATKAIYRKGIALNEMKMYEEALRCFEKVLKFEPNNCSAKDYKIKIEKIVNNKSVKLIINESKTSKVVCIEEILENAETEGKRNVCSDLEPLRITEIIDENVIENQIKHSSNVHSKQTNEKHIKPKKGCNEWGFKKNFCNCNGMIEPDFVKNFKSYLLKNKKIQNESEKVHNKSKIKENNTKCNRESASSVLQKERNVNKKESSKNNKTHNEELNKVDKENRNKKDSVKVKNELLNPTKSENNLTMLDFLNPKDTTEDLDKHNIDIFGLSNSKKVKSNCKIVKPKIEVISSFDFNQNR